MAATPLRLVTQSLVDPTDNPMGQLGPIIDTYQRRLGDFPAAGRIAAGEPGGADVQAGGKARDGQVNQGSEQCDRASCLATRSRGSDRHPTGVASMMVKPSSAE